MISDWFRHDYDKTHGEGAYQEALTALDAQLTWDSPEIYADTVNARLRRIFGDRWPK